VTSPLGVAIPSFVADLTKRLLTSTRPILTGENSRDITAPFYQKNTTLS